LILTLGILGLLVACGLLAALAAQRSGLFGAAGPPPAPTRSPATPTTAGGVVLIPATPAPATATAAPATATAVPPTAPPTATAVPPTATPNLRPVASPTVVPTPTLPPPKPVPTTPPPPPSPTSAPQTGEVRLEDTAFQGGFRGPGDS